MGNVFNPTDGFTAKLFVSILFWSEESLLSSFNDSFIGYICDPISFADEYGSSSLLLEKGPSSLLLFNLAVEYDWALWLIHLF